MRVTTHRSEGGAAISLVVAELVPNDAIRGIQATSSSSGSTATNTVILITIYTVLSPDSAVSSG